MILFVCSGNTCRSPLAAAMARQRGWDAQSAGLYAAPGAPASPGSCRAAERRGLDLWGHRARRLSAEMVEQAERIYVMMDALYALVLLHFPQAAGKLYVLRPAIPDPYGGDDAEYERCAGYLERALEGITAQG